MYRCGWKVGYRACRPTLRRLGPVCKSQPDLDRCYLQHRLVVLRSLLVAGRHPPKVLETIDEPLHEVAGAVDGLIEGPATMLVGPPGYRDVDAQAPQVAPNNPLGVALVGADAPGAFLRRPAAGPLDLPLLHEGPEAYHLIALAFAQVEDHGLAMPFRSYVYLGGKTAPRVA